MEDRIELKKIIDKYLRDCYIVPDYIDLRIVKEKNAYSHYFSSLVCISEVVTQNYLNDVYLNDVKNEFFTYQIKVSNNIEVGSLLIKDTYDVIDDLLMVLIANEWYEAVVNIKKIIG